MIPGTAAFLTAKQIAEAFQLSQHRVYDLARRGVMPSVRIGRQLRFSREAIELWAQSGGSDLSGSEDAA